MKYKVDDIRHTNREIVIKKLHLAKTSQNKKIFDENDIIMFDELAHKVINLADNRALDSVYISFDDIVDFLKHFYRVGSITEVAERLGINQTTLSHWKKTDNIEKLFNEINNSGIGYELIEYLENKKPNFIIMHKSDYEKSAFATGIEWTVPIMRSYINMLKIINIYRFQIENKLREPSSKNLFQYETSKSVNRLLDMVLCYGGVDEFKEIEKDIIDYLTKMGNKYTKIYGDNISKSMLILTPAEAVEIENQKISKRANELRAQISKKAII